MCAAASTPTRGDGAARERTRDETETENERSQRRGEPPTDDDAAAGAAAAAAVRPVVADVAASPTVGRLPLAAVGSGRSASGVDASRLARAANPSPVGVAPLALVARVSLPACLSPRGWSLARLLSFS